MWKFKLILLIKEVLLKNYSTNILFILRGRIKKLTNNERHDKRPEENRLTIVLFYL